MIFPRQGGSTASLSSRRSVKASSNNERLDFICRSLTNHPLFSPLMKRSESIAAWMNGLEIAYLRADLLSRELMMNTDISTQFIVAPLMDAQKREGDDRCCFDNTTCVCLGSVNITFLWTSSAPFTQVPSYLTHIIHFLQLKYSRRERLRQLVITSCLSRRHQSRTKSRGFGSSGSSTATCNFR